MITIVGTVMCIAVPNYIGANNIFTWITCFRVLMGIGIGGDYPMR
jgi:PHS family inorganic phosphate transporter-like MFS transporter